MPGVHRQSDSTTGHGCWPPTIPSSWAGTVTCNNLGVVKKGCGIVPHCCPGVPCHGGSYSGSHTVSVEGQDIQTSGDPITCGDHASGCSGNVSVDG